jgi:lysophospholipase L1-like esterase
MPWRIKNPDLTNDPTYLAGEISEVNAQLAEKLSQGEVSVSDIDKNKGKLDQTFMSDEFLQQITGNTPINATPANLGITSEKLSPSAVEWQKTSFIKVGKNLFNYSTRLINYGFDAAGGVTAKNDYDLSDFVPVVSGQEYTLNKSRVVHFYDVTKTIIPTSKIDNSTMASLTTTAPVNAFYMRVQVYKTYSPIMQIEKGSVETSYEPYKMEISKINIKKENMDFNSIDRQHLVDKSVSPSKAEFINLGKNLFNIKKATDGFYLQETSGSLIANASYVTSDYIEVKKDVTYTIKSARKFLKYDLNKVYVSGINQTQGVYTFIPNADGYIRFSYDKTLTSNVQMETGSTVTSYEAYGYTMPDLIVPQSTGGTDILSGKSLYSFGDSIMKGAGNGNVGLRDLIAQKYNMNGANYSVSGASVAYYSDRSHIVAQIQSAISAGITPDFIIMNGGINDVTFNVLGEVSTDFDYVSHGYGSFSAGLEYCFGLLKNTFPSVPFVYIWVHQMPSRIKADQLAHRNRAIEICQKWSIPLVDMYKNGGMNTMLTTHLEQFTYYPTETSGTHPNATGYNKFYVPNVVSEMKRVAW